MGSQPHVFVGDEAFPLRRPFTSTHLSRQERILNSRLSLAGLVVECTFGIMSSQWRMYRQIISLNLDNVEACVKATCILHNFMRSNRRNGRSIPPADGPPEEDGKASGVLNICRWGNNNATRETFKIRDLLAVLLWSGEELFDEVEVKPSKVKESKKLTTQEALSRIVSEEKTGKKRKPKVCPVEGCGTTVVHLPPHLRQIHKWTKERAVLAVQMFGLRTSQQQQQHVNRKQDYHHTRPCPVEGCHGMVKQMPQHLKKFHKLTKADAACRELLLKVRQTRPKKADNYENLKQNSISFEGWLQSVDGGMKSTKSARQHRKQVQTVVSVIDPQKLLPNSLLNKTKFREDFLTQYTI
ncbi:hypothetical protein SKAU_G00385540 [Synaphobranchus kaupii]|uniref:DDE Tnp4 domain-containing protein n=1 Tax=Synaphobranchus kaupii TaxID=118154 RepID=A0A9Q1IF43_SYNKA|nr:hypothetical protein SKAU_G00385540 [Synaphobranchus kaupii]